MQLDVYDTYATSLKGNTVHFDVFLPSGDTKTKASMYAQEFLEKIGESTESISLDRCNYCHTQTANPYIKQRVEEDGHFILQMEGCPQPYQG